MSEDAAATDLHVEDLVRDQVAVGALGAQPEDIAQMERCGAAQFLKPGGDSESWLAAKSARHHPRSLPQRPGAPARSTRALPHVLGRHRIDLFGPAPLQRVAHVELQSPNPVDVNGGMLAVLEWPDALVVGPQ